MDNKPEVESIMKWSELAKQSDDVAKMTASMFFFGDDYSWKKPSKNEVRKISYGMLYQLVHQSAILSRILVIEDLFIKVRDIRNDSTLKDSEKVDIFFGEMEAFLQTNTKVFSTNYDARRSMGSISIDEIRRRYRTDGSTNSAN